MDKIEALKTFHAAIADSKDPGDVLQGLPLGDVLQAHHDAGHLHLTALFALNVTGHMDLAIYSETLPGPTFEYEVSQNSVKSIPQHTTAGYARQQYRDIFLEDRFLEGFVRKHHLLGRNDFQIVLAEPQEVSGAVCALMGYAESEEVLATVIVRGNGVEIDPVDVPAVAA